MSNFFNLLRFCNILRFLTLSLPTYYESQKATAEVFFSGYRAQLIFNSCLIKNVSAKTLKQLKNFRSCQKLWAFLSIASHSFSLSLSEKNIDQLLDESPARELYELSSLAVLQFFCVVNNANPSFLKRKKDFYVHFNERLIKTRPFNF